MLDLRGHGRSADHDRRNSTYSLGAVSNEIIEVMDDAGVDEAHFVGVSLGTLLMRELLDTHPHRIRSMVMAGAITKLTALARFLIAAGNLLKHVIPFRVLYATFAWIIMPGKRARESRMVFRREARKVTPSEFRRWLRLTAEIKNRLPQWRRQARPRPVLYAMGSHDYMFLPAARALAERYAQAYLEVFPDCGHVSNVEKPEAFNAAAEEAYYALRESKPDAEIVVIGESIGSGPACYLATTDHPPGRIVLFTPFATMVKLASHHARWFPASLIIKDDWDNIEALKGYKGKLQIYGAKQDRIIPMDHAKILADSVSGSEWIELDCDHNGWAKLGEVELK